MASGQRFSAEIQGLRAIAVLSVLVFHIWPKLMPGGYVGVDVFFVISGYLITGALLRELERTGTVSIGGFYQRRIKRLLPAATVVILGAACAYRLQPVVTWAATAKATVASTLYTQNWWLAHQATDYWAQDDTPGALQHFWSLAVEEQFYIVWPLVILFAAWIARKAGRAPLSLIRTSLLLIGIASFAHCVLLTRTDPSLAYFATTTRAWELVLGAALAAWPLTARVSPARSSWVAASGMTMILAACFCFTEKTLFPGYAAMLPTVGAVFIIASGTSSSRWSVSRLLRTRVAQFYGDISYSLYLWHWPVLIFYRHMSERPPNLVDGVIVFVLSGALAHQTKVLVEDTFRKPGVFDRRRLHTFSLALACMALTLAAAWRIDQVHTRKLRAAKAPALDQKYFDSVHTLNESDRIIAALRAKEDMAPWYKSKCRGHQKAVEPIPCTHGDPASKFTVVLIGDSHAVHWEPAFANLASEQSWNFSMYAKTMCSMGDQSVTIGQDRVLYDTCDSYRKNVLAILKRDKPDLVIISQSSGHKPFGLENEDEGTLTIAMSLERTVRSLEAEGIEVLLMADTPWLKRSAPECLSAPGYSPGSCDVPIARARRRKDPVLLLERSQPPIGIIKMNPYLCDDVSCKVIVDGQIAFKDAHHLTARFSASLASKLGEELRRLRD